MIKCTQSWKSLSLCVRKLDTSGLKNEHCIPEKVRKNIKTQYPRLIQSTRYTYITYWILYHVYINIIYVLSTYVQCSTYPNNIQTYSNVSG